MFYITADDRLYLRFFELWASSLTQAFIVFFIHHLQRTLLFFAIIIAYPLNLQPFIADSSLGLPARL